MNQSQNFAGQHLKLATHAYILQELGSAIDDKIFDDPKTNEIEKIQKILDNSDYQLRMYGSAEELGQNLKIYRNFPESYQFFGTHYEPSDNTVTVYKSLKGEKYVYKNDLFVLLQQFAFENFLESFPGSNTEDLRFKIVSALRITENKLLKKIEFVKHNPKVFDEVQKEMKELTKIGKIDLDQLESELASGNFANILAKFKMCNMKDTWDHSQVLLSLTTYYHSLPKGKKGPAMAHFLLPLVIVKCYTAIIDKRPEMFNPFAENYKGPVAVRLFVDGDQKFLLKAEIVNAINKTTGNKGDFNDEGHKIETISLENVREKFGGRIKNIEFILTPYLRAKHRAVPIREFDSDQFCILALDAFFEFFRRLIFGIKMFRKYRDPTCEIFPDIFDAFTKKTFLPDHKNLYFLRDKLIREILLYIAPESEFPNKDVRNAKKDGFTVQNLKNELAHLSLTESFPEIQNYAEAVYSEIEKNKKGDVLRTCDLFDAIEQCLLICVLENYPKFKKFVHNQKGCHRVIGLNCDSCRTTVKKDQKIEAPRSKILPEKDQKIEAPRSKILPEKDQKIADASQFLEIPDNALTPMGLHKEAMYYIIDEIRPNLDKIKYPKIISGNEKELFLSMMKVSNQKLEMYGSAEELLENVKIYRSFPKIHKFFLTDLEPFQTTPTIYRNLNDKPYICKHDLFVILQNLVAKIFKNSDLEFLTIVAYHLKQQAEKLGDSMEFVPLDTNVLKDIQEELRIDMSRRLKAHNHRKLKIEMSQLSYPKIIEIFKKITPIDWDPNRHDRIETLIKHYGRTAKNERARIEELSTLYTATRITVECLQNVIEKHPELFLPDRKTVRLFEDGDEQFVMRSEVLDILRTKGTPEHIFLSTMKLADISGKNIEFIRYPIHRAKHCAVPIPGPSGFYVLAVDSLLETLKMMIFGLKLFQKRGNWDVDRWRIQLMDAMGPMFNTVYKKEEKDPYFFHHEIVNVCRQQFLECFGNTLNLPTADIRSVKPQGFTLEDLKIELTHLGLTDMFPDILYHTGRVYSEIEKNKKGRCLRTCDLYYAIENCQLICIFNRIINLKIFLHNQKGCKRVLGLECEYCDKDEQ
ncbi:hypothetical protein L5515_013207 [Caenorhabditis briggsae]|uniref:DUF7809 domain-containing protein n=2 Tax=Caenorhabditis briggsae TaxID=6238 RepID=A0AAE9E7J3_CAEBR|nr:hypothetical protein L5515_013207 [Caenorhabditis briggsae]